MLCLYSVWPDTLAMHFLKFIVTLNTSTQITLWDNLSYPPMHCLVFLMLAALIEHAWNIFLLWLFWCFLICHTIVHLIILYGFKFFGWQHDLTGLLMPHPLDSWYFFARPALVTNFKKWECVCYMSQTIEICNDDSDRSMVRSQYLSPRKF